VITKPSRLASAAPTPRGLIDAVPVVALNVAGGQPGRGIAGSPQRRQARRLAASSGPGAQWPERSARRRSRRCDREQPASRSPAISRWTGRPGRSRRARQPGLPPRTRRL